MRVGIEASEKFDAWHKGRGSPETKPASAGEILVAQYRGGQMDVRRLANNSMNGPIDWVDWSDPKNQPPASAARCLARFFARATCVSTNI